MTPTEIAPDVYRLGIGGFVNAYLVGDRRGWVFVDAGVAGQFEALRDAAEQRFGYGEKPAAIILTHGHGDHVGSALALAVFYDVPVYAHRMELPYLTGKSDYAPADPTTGGPFALAVRFAPGVTRGTDLGEYVHALPDDGTVPGLGAEWRWVATPGHTPGHISLFRERDRVLVTGDAVATIYVDTLTGIAQAGTPQVSPPPAPVTPDWHAARRSVEALAALEPRVIAPGHGEPMTGAGATASMRRAADGFRVPQTGRYVPESAEFDAWGVRYVPPAPADPLPLMVGIALAAVGIGFGVWAAQRSLAIDRKQAG